MDIGSFVLDAEGVRWALELSGDDYSLPNYFDFNSGRWNYYRLNNRGHNTLVINNQLQNKNAAVPIQTFYTTPELAYSRLDLTQAYSGQASSVRRGFALVNRSQVVIEDELVGVPSGQSIRWGMITPATIALDGSKALFTQHAPSDEPETDHVFTVAADAMIRDNASATLNYGGRTTVDLKGFGSGTTRKGYFRFDTASLPVPKSQITRARLDFKVAKGNLAGSQIIDLYALRDGVNQSGRLGENWLEGTANGAAQSGALTWSNAPANNTGNGNNTFNTAFATSLETKTLGSPATNSFVTYRSRPHDTFLRFVRADTDDRHTFLLRRTDNADAATFDLYAKENAAPAAEPARLTLTTQPPGPLVALQTEILEPAGAVFDILSTDPGSPTTQTPNWGTQMLAVRVNATSQPTRIVIAFTPVRDGTPLAPPPSFRPLAAANPALPVLSLHAPVPETGEWPADLPPARLALRRAGELTPALSVTPTLTGTATNGVDYAAIPQPLTLAFTANDTGPRHVAFDPLPDELAEGTETAGLFLQPSSFYTISGPDTVTALIHDTPRDAWRHAHGYVGAWTDEPAADGHPALLRYFLGLPAQTPVSGPLFVTSVAPAHLVLEFDRAHPAPPDLVYRVEASSDLAAWDHGPDHVVLEELPPADGVQRIIARDRAPLDEHHKRRFLRLRIELE